MLFVEPRVQETDDEGGAKPWKSLGARRQAFDAEVAETVSDG